MYEDTKYIDSDSLLNKTSASIALATFTVLFQSGFFWSMPIELMTFMSPGHFLINTAVIVPIFGMFIGVFYWFWCWVCEIVARGGDLTEIPLMNFMSTVDENWPLLILAFALLIIVSIVFPQHKYLTDEIVSIMSLSAMLLGSIFGCSVVLWNLSIILRDVDSEGHYVRGALFKTITTFVATSFTMGLLYGEYIVGEECVFISKNQVMTADLIVWLLSVMKSKSFC